MRIQRAHEIHEAQEQREDVLPTESLSVDEANKIFDEILDMDESKYEGSTTKEISFGSTASTS